MQDSFQIKAEDWHSFLLDLSGDNTVYVPVKTFKNLDYKIFTKEIENIVYNVAKPVTPLKNFFLPVKENVFNEKKNNNKQIIIGIPSCDLKALEILDEIYLDNRYPDPFYKDRRKRSVLIGNDCFKISDHCHCNSYGIEPYPVEHADASLSQIDNTIIVSINTEKGKELLNQASAKYQVQEPQAEILKIVQERRNEIKKQLTVINKTLPDYKTTGELIKKSDDDIWIKHSRTCVSCGACAVICPTCTCFLLIDRPDFEKVRQVDACQYPGFERIAAGEDPLHKRFVRFRNRYLCKYVWKPESFNSIACTGCGRCIESCIGNISKNEIFIEMNTAAQP
ncbi:MAG: 4Fe-4S dicluster domain-containing protein [Bacteroidales bacterium]|nr:4Fe-4S dicluster domain-containing protein [Bacteroidales bacterium]